MKFLNLKNAIETIKDLYSDKCIDIIALPQDTVDCLTDEENAHLPIDNNIISDKQIPDIPKHVKIFLENNFNILINNKNKNE